MPKKSENLFSAENVCPILLRYGLISEDQKEEIFKKKATLKRKLEKLRAMRHASASSRGRMPGDILLSTSSFPWTAYRR